MSYIFFYNSQVELPISVPDTTAGAARGASLPRPLVARPTLIFQELQRFFHANTLRRNIELS